MVNVIEPPGGSALRRLGAKAVPDVWWPIIGRNKRSLALDPGPAAATDLLATVPGAADIVFVDDALQGRAVQACLFAPRSRA